MRNVLCKTYPVQRAAGHSAVAGAAYRAGVSLVEQPRADEAKARRHNYAGRQHDVREAFILTPSDAPDWASDRSSLWNRVEAFEKRKDARVAREVMLGFAVELAPEAQRDLVVEFAQREFVDKGFVVDVAIHNYGQRVNDLSERGRDTIRRWAALDIPFLEAGECQDLYDPHVKIERTRDGAVLGYKVYQPHCHLYVTPRQLDGDGFAAKKDREFNRHEVAKEWRYEWPKLQNRYLADAGIDLEVTATSAREDAAPDVRYKRESERHEAYAIEQRGDLTPEEAALHDEALRKQAEKLERNRTHNDAIEIAVALAQEDASAPDEAADRKERQAALWWQAAHKRFDQWKDRFHEQAAVWKERFAQQRERVFSAIGYRMDEPDDQAARDQIDREPER